MIKEGKLYFLQKSVTEFLAPLRPVAIRIVRNAHGNKTGKVRAPWGGSGETEGINGRLGQLLRGDVFRAAVVFALCPQFSGGVGVLRTRVCLRWPCM